MSNKVTCEVQFLKNGTPCGKKYMYNFPSSYAKENSVYIIAVENSLVSRPYDNPVVIVKSYDREYRYVSASNELAFTYDCWGMEDLKLITSVDVVRTLGQVNNLVKKETATTMTNSVNNIFGMNVEFGKVPAGKFKMSFYGLAFSIGDDRYAIYNTEDNELMDVTEMTMNMDMIFQVPVAVSEVVEGDIIKHKDSYVIVKGETENGSICVIDPFKREEITIIPTKNIFGFNYVTKVVNIFSDIMEPEAMNPTKENPFGNIMPYMLMSEMFNNDSKADNSDSNIMKMMLMSQMFCGNNKMDLDFSKNPMMAMMFAKNF